MKSIAHLAGAAGEECFSLVGCLNGRGEKEAASK